MDEIQDELDALLAEADMNFADIEWSATSETRSSAEMRRPTQVAMDSAIEEMVHFQNTDATVSAPAQLDKRTSAMLETLGEALPPKQETPPPPPETQAPQEDAIQQDLDDLLDSIAPEQVDTADMVDDLLSSIENQVTTQPESTPQTGPVEPTPPASSAPTKVSKPSEGANQGGLNLKETGSVKEAKRVFDVICDQDKIYVVGAEQVVNVFDVQSRQNVGSIPMAHDKVITRIRARKGKLYTSAWDGNVKIWDQNNYKNKPTVLRDGHSDKITGILPISEKLLLSCGKDGCVQFWDTTSQKVLKSILSTKAGDKFGHDGGIQCLAATNNFFVTGGTDKKIKLWSKELCRLLHDLVGHTDWVTSIEMLHKRNALVSAGRDGAVQLWDLNNLSTTTKPQFSLEDHHKDQISSMFLADPYLFTASFDKSIKIVDIRNWNVVQHIPAAHKKEVTGLAVHPGSHTLISTSWDSTVKWWNY